MKKILTLFFVIIQLISFAQEDINKTLILHLNKKNNYLLQNRYNKILSSKNTIFVVFKKNKDLFKVMNFKGKKQEINLYPENIVFNNYNKIEFKENKKVGKILTLILNNKDYKDGNVHLFGDDILELMIFNYILEKDKIDILETYLSIKHGISLNKNKDYFNSFYEKIWDHKNNKGFNYRVTGLSLDENINLKKYQSSNLDSDTLNISLIRRRDNMKDFYLIWGDNNKPFKFKLLSNDEEILERSWKYESQNLNKNNSLKLSFKNIKDKYNLKNYNYWLVFSQDTNFNNLKYVPITVSDNKDFNFNNFTLEYETGYFTLYRIKKDNFQQERLKIFPNPVSVTENVTLNFNNLEKPSTIEIYISEIGGKLIYGKKLVNVKGDLIEKIKFPKIGIYLIKTKLNNSVFVKKIIVK